MSKYFLLPLKIFMLCTTKYNIFNNENNTYTNFVQSCVCILFFILSYAIPLFIIGIIACQIVYLSYPINVFYEFCTIIFHSYIVILYFLTIFPIFYLVCTLPFIIYKLIKSLLLHLQSNFEKSGESQKGISSHDD